MNYNPFLPQFKLRSMVSQPIVLSPQRGRRREPESPLVEMPAYKPSKKYYYFLTEQPFRVYFSFKPKHIHRDSVGYVAFTLFIAEREYGPYLTDIWTTTKTFSGRTRIKITERSRMVSERIQAILRNLDDSWASYDQKDKPITGEMVLAKSGLRETQGEGGLYYAI